MQLFIIDKFKDRIKGLCGQYGISQKFLCDQIGKQKTYFNDVWRGRCTPTDADLQTIAGHLHTTPAYLRGETDYPEQETKNKEASITPTVQELIDEVYDMTDNEAAAFLSLIREIKGRRT